MRKIELKWVEPILLKVSRRRSEILRVRRKAARVQNHPKRGEWKVQVRRIDWDYGPLGSWQEHSDEYLSWI